MLISIIVPIYNVEKYLRQCLDSIAAQTLQYIEVICVNDGSTDGSLAIIKEYVEKDPRFKVIDKSNSGYGHTMNTGFDAATGEYIGIVESDDFIKDTMFETLYALSEGGKVDIVKGNFWDYHAEKGKVPEAFVNNERANIPDITAPFTIREQPEILWGHPSVWSAIYRQKFLIENGIVFQEFKGAGWVDNPFFFETLCNAKTVMWTKEPLYYYRKTSENSSSKKFTDPSLPFARMMDNLDIIEKSGYTDDVILHFMCARALMYMRGAFFECDYDFNYDIINDYAKRLMQRLDPRILQSDFNLHDQYDYFRFASPLKTMNKTNKILIYNWLPFDNIWNWGGGVTVYCKNIIAQLLKERPDVEITFLSSGFAYVAAELRTFVCKIPNIYGDKVQQFEIVNSPIPAEQRWLLTNPLVALENESLKAVIKEFIEKTGSYKAIHFQNLEGLSLDCLDLKEDFPDSKFIFSIHNYVSMCVTGSYYQRHNRCNCTPLHTGLDCFNCTRTDIRRDAVALAIYKRGLFGQDPAKCYSQNKWIKYFGYERLDEDVSPDEILGFAKTATEKLNKNCDEILAVSKRVYDIAVGESLDESKMRVSYIGTKVADGQLRKASAAKPKQGDGLKVVYLGNDLNYEEKGFPWLLETLEQLDALYTAQIDLV
jgi:glycosyltransferase involved in cell wall biosynthesis